MPTLIAGQILNPSPVDTASSAPQATLFTAGGGTATYGSYADLLTSANNPNGLVGFYLRYSNQSVGILSAEIAFGDAGSEVNVITPLPLAYNVTRPGQFEVFIPLAVPRATRVSMRIKGSGASATVRAQLVPVRHGMRMGGGFSRFETFGFTVAANGTAPSFGVTVDGNSGAANTRGTLIQIAAATTFNAKGYILVNGTTGATTTTTNLLFTLLAGAAAAEVDRPLVNLHFFKHSSYGFPPPFNGPYYDEILSGTRLSGQTAASLIAANDRALAMAIILFG